MATPEKTKNIFQAAAKRAGKTPSEISGWSNLYFTNNVSQSVADEVEDKYIALMHDIIKHEQDQQKQQFRKLLHTLLVARDILSKNIEEATELSVKWFLKGRLFQTDILIGYCKNKVGEQ